MHFSPKFIDMLLHPDRHLSPFFQHQAFSAYLIVFIIIFCETGLVVTPFLPGDSLIFVLGMIGRNGFLSIPVIILIVVVAALTGDTTNYVLGSKFGHLKFFQNDKSKIFNRKHLERTHEFFEVYGGRTIILARFIPVVRTFAPFVAGIAGMAYKRFIAYSFVAASLWVSICITIGYFVGNTKWAKDNFTVAAMGLVIISAVLPVISEYVSRKLRRRKAARAKAAEALKSDVTPVELGA